jgi:ATP-dependent RNA helicase RhlE
VHPVDKARKRELLSHLIGANNWRQVLVFTRTKHGANRLAGQLEHDGLSAAAIHGNKSQGARTRALAGFKDGSVRILVATDIAARGLDIDQLPHVVNYELPNVAEDYVHRIGRTGRAGNEGEAMSLVCVDELRLLRDIERLLGRKIRSETLPGYEPDPSIAAEPIENGRNKGRRPQGGEGRSRPARAGGGQGRTRSAEAGGESTRPGRPAGGRRPQQSRNKAPQGGNPQREVNGNTARPPREADGNRAKPPREVDGNRQPPRREADGNRAAPTRGKEGGGQGRSDNRSRPARRDKPALLGG